MSIEGFESLKEPRTYAIHSEWVDEAAFDLHAELAEQSSENWGYRRLVIYGGFGSARTQTRAGQQNPIGWVSSHIEVGQQLGIADDTAQVHPARFTAAMMRAAQAQVAEFRLGTVTGIAQTAGRVAGVEVDGAIIEADAIVIAMGPWSILAAAWLPLPAVYGLKGHSLVFDTGPAIPAWSDTETRTYG